MPRFRPFLLLVLLCLGACQGVATGPEPSLANPGLNPAPNSTATPAPDPTATPAPIRARFFSFGDWGTGTPSQFAVADAVAADCQAKGCDFGLLLGDNFYDIGVDSVTDPQWRTKFEDVYTIDAPFFAVLGNHDYDGNEQAQIDYTALQSRWKLPARAYTIRFPETAASPLLEIFVIDSNAFDAAAALALRDALNASTAVWKLLALHHPIYSNGSHGDDSAGINSLLLPIICAQVDAVFAGHDHLFSHLEDPDDGCPFPQFVIGTGGRGLYPANPDSRSLFSESSFGFARVEVEADRLSLEFRRSDLSLGYTVEIQK